MSGQGKGAALADDSNQQVRIDLWLWAVRIFKTRSLAASACRGSKVRANDQTVKPARVIRVGDRIEVRRGAVTCELEVRAIPSTRVGAKRVEEYVIDHTPPEIYEEAARQSRERRAMVPARGDSSSGRPTKKDRRAWSRASEKAAAREAAVSERMRKSAGSGNED
jgi:ribosome-associated heat shock protein Hsp15